MDTLVCCSNIVLHMLTMVLVRLLAQWILTEFSRESLVVKPAFEDILQCFMPFSSFFLQELSTKKLRYCLFGMMQSEASAFILILVCMFIM